MPSPALNRLVELNTKDCLWVYILRILKEKPMHGYLIRSEIEKRFSFKPGTMTAYKVLYLLTRAGLVKKTQEGRKRVYIITPKGRQELSQAVKFYNERVSLLKG